MLKATFTEEDMRALAPMFRSSLLMANPERIFEKMFEEIRAQRQANARFFGGYDPVLVGTPKEWAQWAKAVACAVECPHLGVEVENLFVTMEREAVDDMLREKSSTTPEGVPQGYLCRGVDANGYNIGLYIFQAGDRHFWLPPEEAVKERPDLSKGIDDAPFRKARDARSAKAFNELMNSPGR